MRHRRRRAKADKQKKSIRIHPKIGEEHTHKKKKTMKETKMVGRAEIRSTTLSETTVRKERECRQIRKRPPNEGGGPKEDSADEHEEKTSTKEKNEKEEMMKSKKERRRSRTRSAADRNRTI